MNKKTIELKGKIHKSTIYLATSLSVMPRTRQKISMDTEDLINTIIQLDLFNI